MTVENPKIRRPRKIKIADKDYKVVSKSKLWAKRNRAMGQIHFDKQTIEFDKHQTVMDLVDTLIHEILHGVINEYNIPVKQEEKLVTNLANSLTDVFTKNPNLLPWLQSRIAKAS